jgi:hypothetical protein
MRRGPSLLVLIYIAVGIVIAANRHYFSHLGSLHAIISAILVVLLWPLVVLGWVHIKHYR